MATRTPDPRKDHKFWRTAGKPARRRGPDPDTSAAALCEQAPAGEDRDADRAVTGKADPLLDAAVRLLGAVEVELVTTAQDMADREMSRPTLGTVVAALVERLGERARGEGPTRSSSPR